MPSLLSDALTEPVNRARRFRFVSAVVAYSLLAATMIAVAGGLGFLASNVALVQSVVNGLNTLALTLSVAYVSGSVIDYNGGFAGVLGRRDTASAEVNIDQVDVLVEDAKKKNSKG